MGIVKHILGPRSKYDKSLPYTYMARIPVIDADQDLWNYYFADTICGLIEYLDEQDLAPGDMQMFGLYQGEEIPIPTESCISEDGQWLTRPDICRSLEKQYHRTLENRYKGHVETGQCSYEDRERKGSGPY